MSCIERNLSEKHGYEVDVYHLRSTADQILQSNKNRDIYLDPLSLPIAGCRSVSHGSAYPSLDEVPRELLPFSHTPIILIDLDETVWPHAQYLVKAVGEASGKPITMERFRQYGHTRKIPEWNDEETMAIHDKILHGSHEVYYPFINPAYIPAIQAITAVERMGHTFAYVTSRPTELFNSTKRAIQWNNLPLGTDVHTEDLLFDPMPVSGSLYCTQNLPDLPGISDKSTIANRWLRNLRQGGWKGRMIIIDDLLSSYGDVLKQENVLGVALSGVSNEHISTQPHEIRLDSWQQIGDLLMDVHKEAVMRNGLPIREFELQGQRLSVSKQETGCGAFSHLLFRSKE